MRRQITCPQAVIPDLVAARDCGQVVQRLAGCTNSRLHVSCKLELVTVSGVGCTVRVRSCAQNVGAVVAEEVKCQELGVMALFL